MGVSRHTQSQGLKNPQRKAVRSAYYSMANNIVLAIGKAIAGVLGNSYALIADAIESTMDVCASFLVLIGIRYSNRPADENHPYGHGRAEPLIAFIIVGFLVASASLIAYQSIINIRTPHKLPAGWTLIVLAAVIIWKEVSYRMVLRRSKETNSSTLKAEAWHHRSDAITSVAAFIGISIALLMGEGYETADDWAALFAAGFILYNSYKIFRPALGELMDEHTYDELVEQIRSISANVEGIIDTEKCYVRKVGLHYHVDLHATVDGTISVREGHDIAHLLKDTLKEKIPEIAEVLIHIEPNPHH